ncbi:MAG: PilT/PilU family type 4a pilus ATPase [Candidatus Moranbacteria bacterium]|nr:PilT/PilU family type 4a pilus ATPase [Candidatus Moranbacteria bacterium]
MQISLKQILAAASQANASDIHIASGEKVAIRTVGDICFLESFGVITKEAVQEIVQSLLDEKTFSLLQTQKEHDFSYSPSEQHRYRCNVFYRRGMLSLSMRAIEKKLLTLEEIGTPEKIQDLLLKKQGLILLSGPAGSGKSTTMAAMLDWINSNRTDHIITIEDPIEYYLENKNCFISQRELHSDTKSFANSLRAAMRQDPNIIVIGEIRDRETMEAVLRLCNTGHLVISTIHTSSASQTIYRILSMFPQEQHKIILSQFSEALLGILNQRLVPTKDSGRIAIFELLLANHAVKNAMRNQDIAQVENTIATSSTEGMLTFKNHIEQLFAQGKIDPIGALATIE